MRDIQELTPSQIVRELDKYIIGQDEAKRSVAIALRNRFRRRQVTSEIRDEILPNNIIMIGPTGVGKTEIARRLARLARAPFLKVEASKFTEVGYVGRDVESMIRDLTEISVNMVRAEMGDKVRDKAERNVEERLLELLPEVETRESYLSPSRAISSVAALVVKHLEAAEAQARRREALQAELAGLDRYLVFLSTVQSLAPHEAERAGLEYIGVEVRDPAALEQLTRVAGSVLLGAEVRTARAADGSWFGLLTTEKELAEKLKAQGIVMLNLRGGLLAWVHDSGKVYDRNGETRRIHVYGRKWDLGPKDYEAVW